MLEQAVHAGIGTESHEVQLGAARFHPGERGAPDGIAGDLTVGDRLRDAHDLLVDDPARADVLVSNLAVAHHAFGHTDIEAAGLDQRDRIVGVQPVVARLAREVHGVERVLCRIRVLAPAVANDKEHGSALRTHGEKRLAGAAAGRTPVRGASRSVMRGRFATSNAKIPERPCPGVHL